MMIRWLTKDKSGCIRDLLKSREYTKNYEYMENFEVFFITQILHSLVSMTNDVHM
jgi:hypothetical protein